jgi:hypothetical protein
MPITVRAGRRRIAPPLDLRFRDLVALQKIDINTATENEIENKLSVPAALAKKIVKARKEKPFRMAEDLVVLGKDATKLSPKVSQLVFLHSKQVDILDVQIKGERIFSNKPFQLLVNFVPPSGGHASLVSVTTYWRGTPFVLQQTVSEEENRDGQVLVSFNEEHILPPGLMRLHITLYDDLGGADNFELETWVYPSNPFSFFLSPRNRSIYNGSIRPDWDGTNWVTAMNVTFVNGDNATVSLTRNMTWKFWDGGVGATNVESGNFTWFEDPVIGPYGTYSAWLSFTSPPGSGIYNRYEDKEDMTIEIIFRKTTGAEVKATITCRIMAGYGINIIYVGDYTGAEQGTIANGVNDARDVYENYGLTFSSVEWWGISNAQAGGYTVLNDHDEWEDLLDDWTVPNESVDVFVTRGFWDSYAGWSPTPGPDDKDGWCEDDGLAIELSTQCLAHELGHYMGGLEHADSEGPDNVMNSVCGGRDFTYDQYKEFFDHEWTRIVR